LTALSEHAIIRVLHIVDNLWINVRRADKIVSGFGRPVDEPPSEQHTRHPRKHANPQATHK